MSLAAVARHRRARTRARAARSRYLADARDIHPMVYLNMYRAGLIPTDAILAYLEGGCVDPKHEIPLRTAYFLRKRKAARMQIPRQQFYHDRACAAARHCVRDENWWGDCGSRLTTEEALLRELRAHTDDSRA